MPLTLDDVLFPDDQLCFLPCEEGDEGKAPERLRDVHIAQSTVFLKVLREILLTNGGRETAHEHSTRALWETMLRGGRREQ